MPNCPLCLVQLRTVRQRKGIYFYCDQCSGRAVTIPQVRRAGGNRFATTLLRQMKASQASSQRHCPFCTRQMRLLASQEPSLELDACRPCNVIWFDPTEFESVPEQSVIPPEKLPQRAAEMVALHRIELMKELEDADPCAPPEETWKWLPGVFGMPVEMSGMQVSGRPWFTWGLAIAIALVSLLAFTNLDAVISHWGMIPAEWWRYGGLTFFSSFLLHGGWFHLIGNLYFLVIFGDNVEDYLGRWRAALLIVAATVAGDVFHVLADPGSDIPCVGASGGISGIIVFYALQFPRARLGILFHYYIYFRWIRFPAWVALLLWIGMQIFGATLQMQGLSNVSALAHLGGAGVGFVTWLIWRRIEERPASDEG